jgi:hypothetical protein
MKMKQGRKMKEGRKEDKGRKMAEVQIFSP